MKKIDRELMYTLFSRIHGNSQRFITYFKTGEGKDIDLNDLSALDGGMCSPFIWAIRDMPEAAIFLLRETNVNPFQNGSVNEWYPLKKAWQSSPLSSAREVVNKEMNKTRCELLKLLLAKYKEANKLVEPIALLYLRDAIRSNRANLFSFAALQLLMAHNHAIENDLALNQILAEFPTGQMSVKSIRSEYTNLSKRYLDGVAATAHLATRDRIEALIEIVVELPQIPDAVIPFSSSSAAHSRSSSSSSAAQAQIQPEPFVPLNVPNLAYTQHVWNQYAQSTSSSAAAAAPTSYAASGFKRDSFNSAVNQNLGWSTGSPFSSPVSKRTRVSSVTSDQFSLQHEDGTHNAASYSATHVSPLRFLQNHNLPGTNIVQPQPSSSSAAVGASHAASGFTQDSFYAEINENSEWSIGSPFASPNEKRNRVLSISSDHFALWQEENALTDAPLLNSPDSSSMGFMQNHRVAQTNSQEDPTSSNNLLSPTTLNRVRNAFFHSPTKRQIIEACQQAGITLNVTFNVNVNVNVNVTEQVSVRRNLVDEIEREAAASSSREAESAQTDKRMSASIPNPPRRMNLG